MGNWKLRLEIQRQRVRTLPENMGCRLRQWKYSTRSLFYRSLIDHLYSRDFQIGGRFV